MGHGIGALEGGVIGRGGEGKGLGWLSVRTSCAGVRGWAGPVIDRCARWCVGGPRLWYAEQCAWLATVLPGACVPRGWLTALRSGVAGNEAHLADGSSRDSPSCGDSGEVEELHSYLGA
jgi:hypothetical protein